MRILQDVSARKLYELPDYDTKADPTGEHDVLLQALIDRPDLKFPDGTPHQGNLLVVPDDVWAKRRTEIAREMWRDFADMGDDAILKSWTNTFTEDALKCFSRHGRPTGSCIDYMDDSKRIGSPSRSAALASARMKPVKLCHFCPVHSGYVAAEKRHQAGLYK